MQGIEYVTKPYETVQAKSVDAYSVVPSTGETVVEGVYYPWVNTEEAQGFSGHGWFTNVAGGPTAMYFGLNKEEDAQSYVDLHGNLNTVFSQWAEHYDMSGYIAFMTAVYNEGGEACAHTV